MPSYIFDLKNEYNIIEITMYKQLDISYIFVVCESRDNDQINDLLVFIFYSIVGK